MHLFTDLDGTFIPGDLKSKESLESIRQLVLEKQLSLTYVTGRNLEETRAVIKEQLLPVPEFLVCDVGTTIYKKRVIGFVKVKKYSNLLKNRTGLYSIKKIKNDLAKNQFLRLQETEKQSKYKLSYYFKPDLEVQVKNSVRQYLKDKEWQITISYADRVGLFDILPRGVNKLFAINWLVSSLKMEQSDVLFAGDSGNDVAVFSSGINSIVVNNCSQSVKDSLQKTTTIYLCQKTFTSGVLEGYYYYKKLNLKTDT
jgi:HAD superfamily hydrolase (TIGR01484 family)